MIVTPVVILVAAVVVATAGAVVVNLIPTRILIRTPVEMETVMETGTEVGMVMMNDKMDSPSWVTSSVYCFGSRTSIIRSTQRVSLDTSRHL